MILVNFLDKIYPRVSLLYQFPAIIKPTSGGDKEGKTKIIDPLKNLMVIDNVHPTQEKGFVNCNSAVYCLNIVKLADIV